MFGIRLKELRKEKGFTQSELGRRVNVTKSSISSYENAKRTPNIETLIKISDVLDTSIDYLLGRSDIRKLSEQDHYMFKLLEVINKLLNKYEIEYFGLFDKNSWKIMNKEGLKELANYFQYMITKAKKRQAQSTFNNKP